MRDKCVEMSDNANKMRDRLVELLQKRSCFYNKSKCNTRCSNCDYVTIDENDIGKLADHFLANGGIVPPCKVGDTVYVINEWEVEKTAVFSMKIESEDSGWVVFLKARVTDNAIKSKDGYACIFKTFIFGKTVFLTREEAERTLKGGE